MPSRRAVLASMAGVAAGSLAGCQGYQQAGMGGGGGGAASGGVGSGFAYEEVQVSQEQATHVARTVGELLTAVKAGTQENPAVVWLPPDAAIDMTGQSAILQNVVIASTRTVNHPGAIVYTNSIGAQSTAHSGGAGTGVFELEGNVRLTGFRLRGPTSSVWDHPMFRGYIPFPSGSESERDAFYDRNRSRGITVSGDPCQIDNMEIFGWSDQGISVGAQNIVASPQINNCSIHDCAMTSAGYGVDVQRGHPMISRTFFNACRHMVAGFGYPDAGYTLQNCVFGPAQSLFPVDMHALRENIGGSSDPSSPRYRYRSGGLMRILGCTFMATHVFSQANFSGGNPTPAIAIGGIPSEKVVIQGNTFSHPPPGQSPSVFSQGPTPGYSSEFARFEIGGNNTYNASFNFDIGQG